MKKLTLLLISVVFSSFCYTQEIIELNFNSNNKSFKEKTESIKFKSGKTYKVRINGLNTSYIGNKIESKSYILTSTIPDIIKPIYPGITDASAIRKFNLDQESPDLKGQLNEVYLESIQRYNKLRQLKDYSDSLYNCTKIAVDTVKADLVLKEVQRIFDVKSLIDLKQQVNLALKYIFVANELFKKKMVESPINKIIDNKLIDNYAELTYILESINSENYLLYVNFIQQSLKGKNYIESKPFKAEKDIVDLNLTFIDNYTKDTVYNSSVSFYTRGNFSFDFSTGFFYNNLQEKSFYIKKRDTLINDVLEENNSSIDVSIGALGHFSYKILNYLKAGVCLGAALSPLDGKTRYLFGISLLLGRKKQVGINSGLVLAKMKVLSNSVQNDKTGNNVPIEITSVPTFEKIQKGFYVGITYNINLTKK